MSPNVKQAIRNVWQFAVDGRLNRFILTPWIDHGGYYSMYRLGEQTPDFVLNKVKNLNCGTPVYEGKIFSPWVSQEVRDKVHAVADKEYFFGLVDDIIKDTRMVGPCLSPEEHQEFMNYIDCLFPEGIVTDRPRPTEYTYVTRKSGCQQD